MEKLNNFIKPIFKPTEEEQGTVKTVAKGVGLAILLWNMRSVTDAIATNQRNWHESLNTSLAQTQEYKNTENSQSVVSLIRETEDAVLYGERITPRIDLAINNFAKIEQLQAANPYNFSTAMTGAAKQKFVQIVPELKQPRTKDSLKLSNNLSQMLAAAELVAKTDLDLNRQTIDSRLILGVNYSNFTSRSFEFIDDLILGLTSLTTILTLRQFAVGLLDAKIRFK